MPCETQETLWGKKAFGAGDCAGAIVLGLLSCVVAQDTCGVLFLPVVLLCLLLLCSNRWVRLVWAGLVSATCVHGPTAGCPTKRDRCKNRNFGCEVGPSGHLLQSGKMPDLGPDPLALELDTRLTVQCSMQGLGVRRACVRKRWAGLLCGGDPRILLVLGTGATAGLGTIRRGVAYINSGKTQKPASVFVAVSVSLEAGGLAPKKTLPHRPGRTPLSGQAIGDDVEHDLPTAPKTAMVALLRTGPIKPTGWPVPSRPIPRCYFLEPVSFVLTFVGTCKRLCPSACRFLLPCPASPESAAVSAPKKSALVVFFS